MKKPEKKNEGKNAEREIPNVALMGIIPNTFLQSPKPHRPVDKKKTPKSEK